MNEVKLAFLFPGQGSQAVGMGRDLSEKFSIAKQTFDEADEALGFSLSKLCFEGPEEQLKLTDGRTIENDYWPVMVDGRFRGDLWLAWDTSERAALDQQRQHIETVRGVGYIFRPHV